MEEALVQELENLREENKILRDSLEEVRKETPEEQEKRVETLLRDWAKKMGVTFEQMKEQLAPGAAKLSTALGQQLEENPIPLLIAAFGAGYLVSRLLDRR